MTFVSGWVAAVIDPTVDFPSNFWSPASSGSDLSLIYSDIEGEKYNDEDKVIDVVRNEKVDEHKVVPNNLHEFYDAITIDEDVCYDDNIFHDCVSSFDESHLRSKSSSDEIIIPSDEIFITSTIQTLCSVMISYPLLIMSMLCWEILQFVTVIPTIPSLRKRSRSKQVHTVWNFPRKWMLLSHFMLWNSKQIPESFTLYISSLLSPIDVAIMHIKV